MIPVDEEKLNKLVEAQLENYPRKESDRFSTGRTYTVGTGTQLTITFVLDKTWLVRILRAYADSRTNCSYRWVINGKSELINDIEFRYGKTVHSDAKLIVANTGAADQDFSCRLDGWGDLKGA